MASFYLREYSVLVDLKWSRLISKLSPDNARLLEIYDWSAYELATIIADAARVYLYRSSSPFNIVNPIQWIKGSGNHSRKVSINPPDLLSETPKCSSVSMSSKSSPSLLKGCVFFCSIDGKHHIFKIDFPFSFLIWTWLYESLDNFILLINDESSFISFKICMGNLLI